MKIEATEIPEGITAILEDKERGIYHNLKTAYAFTTSSILDNSRFMLHLGDDRLGENELGASNDYIVFLKDGALHFVYNEKLFGGSAQLTNISGQLLAKTTVLENGSIDVSRLLIGMYFISVEKEGNVYTQKVIVK
jgi:hypothetical protein